LKSIFVIPDSITVDLLITNEGGLGYQFYNPSETCSITITITKADDKNSIAQKIRNHSDDLEYRQYFLRKALKKPDVAPIAKSQVEFPDLMTAEQAAEYLQVSLQTIRNKTSSKELISVKIAGILRYRKEDLKGAE